MEGTPHLQGFVQFPNQRGFHSVKHDFPERTHLEPSRANDPTDAVNYCKKDGDFTERGEAPKSRATKGQMEKERWDNIKALAQQGRVDEIESRVYVTHYSALQRIAKDHMQRPPDLENVCGRWYYGQAGTGKTTTARTEFPAAYIKSRDKWWDGYQMEEHVIMDDIDMSHAYLSGYLKDWGDKWTFKAEVKGGYMWIRPKVFIVTSQYGVDEIWQDEPTLQALERRYDMKPFTKE